MGGVAADVPEICDLVLNGERYMYAPSDDQRAIFGYVLPFIPRYSVEGDFGDNQQDFWYSFTQRDWSKGEQQKFQDRSDEGQRRYWRGKAVDISIPGQVRIASGNSAVTFASNPKCAVGTPATDLVWYATTTNLYSIDATGTISDKGAHGLGAAPTCIATDNNNIYISSISGGSVGIRRFNIGTPAFTTYSGVPASSLVFLNNTLYGYSSTGGGVGGTNSTLSRYPTGGEPVSPTVLFTWQDARGIVDNAEAKLYALGGKVVIFRSNARPNGPELWLYDGVAPARIGEFPPNFTGYQCVVYSGTIFVSGYLSDRGSGIPTVFFYKDGETGILWQAITESTVVPPICVYKNGLMIGDPAAFDGGVNQRILRYDADMGSFSTQYESTTAISTSAVVAGANTFILLIPNTTSGTSGQIIGGSSIASSAQIESSRIDFGTSLPKLFRGITVTYHAAGGTSSFDIEYAVDDGGFITVQTGASSGVEYTIGAPAEGTTHRFVQYRITMNKGSGEPSVQAVTKVQIRAIPVKPTYSQRIYRVSLIGKDGEGHQEFYNGEHNPKDGKEQHADLQTAATKTQFFSITDVMGTYSGIIEKLQVSAIRKDEFIAEITTRQV